jgi:hypothetical protein
MTEIKSGDYPFGTTCKLLIHNELLKLEIIGDFSIHTDKGLFQLPTIPIFTWGKVLVGSPEVKQPIPQSMIEELSNLLK